jgi:hypothetical protein
LKLNASIENNSPQTHFQSKLEDKIRHKRRELRREKLADRLKDGIWKICRIPTQRLYVGSGNYFKSLNRLKIGTEDKLQRN